MYFETYWTPNGTKVSAFLERATAQEALLLCAQRAQFHRVLSELELGSQCLGGPAGVSRFSPVFGEEKGRFHQNGAELRSFWVGLLAILPAHGVHCV